MQVSLIRWAYQALCLNEFSGLALQPAVSLGGGDSSYMHGGGSTRDRGRRGGVLSKVLSSAALLVRGLAVLPPFSAINQPPSCRRHSDAHKGGTYT